MNHLMYADDICVMAPTAIALQKLLDVCYAGAPNSVKFRGGCRGPSKIRQRGGCNNFFTFYALKIELFRVFTLSD